MNFSVASLFTTLFIFFFSVQASPLNTLVERKPMDVFVPKIIKPDSETFWTVGQEATVVWDASTAPENISNGASVVLHNYGILAKGFSLRDGNVTFKVPIVRTGPNFITLFGDSGNYSPVFTIQGADGSVDSSS
ncbi:hypothetical protein CPC08DRAFT_711559 [Agrocybe pediades]|nr:hypothetical protein CPC08DRAFT_711559 [Agrocybe pediades]